MKKKGSYILPLVTPSKFGSYLWRIIKTILRNKIILCQEIRHKNLEIEKLNLEIKGLKSQLKLISKQHDQFLHFLIAICMEHHDHDETLTIKLAYIKVAEMTQELYWTKDYTTETMIFSINRDYSKDFMN